MKQKILSLIVALVAMMVPIATLAMELSVEIGASGYTTFYAPVAVTLPNSVKAYAVEGVVGNVLTLVEKNDVPANEGVILKGEGAFSLTAAEETTSDWANNMLDGCLAETMIDVESGYSYFQFNEEDAVWYKVTEPSFHCLAMKAYLKLPEQMVEGLDMLYIDEKDVPQHSCGDNLTWNLTDGELVIEGTGAMYDFEVGTAPWYAHKDEIVKLTIKSGVTSVGSYAFNECDKITEVIIPNGVTTLGTHAFGYCDGLTVVSLPPSVRIIGWSAFYTCRNLKVVNLSEGVTRIGEYSFADCRNLSIINIPEGVTEIAQWAFRNCPFTSLILPSTLTAIQSNAFFDCGKLSSLTCLATTPPGLWGGAFATVNSSVNIYVPSASVADYQSQEQWNTFTIQAVCSGDSDHSFTNGICAKCGAYEPAVDSDSDGYYEMGNAGQLYWFANYVNSGNYSVRAVLTADIDLENRKWTPIAYFNEAVDPYIDNHYKGVFDGNNHVIKNLNVHVTDGREAGLFSRFNFGTLKNLGVINARVQSDPFNEKSIRAGVLAGEIHDATVTNVFSCGNISIITDHHQKGGIAGECNYSYMNNCYTTYGTLTDTNVRGCSNCFYLADEANANSAGTAVTAAQMASGEVAYNLGSAYGQTIGKEAYPVLGGTKVYYGYRTCTDSEKSYSNDELSETPSHNYIDGVCEHCGELAEARWGESLANLTHAGTMEEAFAAAKSGSASYILMQKDVAGMTTNAVPYLYIKGGDFTLDLNGCTLTCEHYGLSVSNGANWVVTDSSVDKDGKLISDREIVLFDANVTFSEVTVRSDLMVVYGEGKVNVTGGTFAVEAIRPEEGSVTTISGGTITNLLCYYEGGKLDLFACADPSKIKVRYQLGNTTVIGPETIVLPDGYCFFDAEGLIAETFSADNVYTIAEYPTTWYAIDFDANGGAGEMEDASTHGKYRLPECTFTAPEGKMFKAWLVNEVEYQPNVVITVAGNTTITAVWGTPYTLAFSANGGVGSLVAVKTLNTVTLPECPFLAPEDKVFSAWRIGGDEYGVGAVATLSENAVAYAVWKDVVSERLTIELHDMLMTGGGSALDASYLVIKKDGDYYGEVRYEDIHTMRDFDYDPNAEYAFYWCSDHFAHDEDFRIEIRLGDTRLYSVHSHELRDYYDEPFFTIPRKAQVTAIETLNIIDGELPEYLVLREAEVGMVTYTRNLPNQEWNSLYLPFEIPLSELTDDYEVAYFNDMHAYDRNRDGQIDELEMEIILLEDGVLHANHPYFVRAKSEDAQAMYLQLSDVAIKMTEENVLTCSSVYTNFFLNGIYSSRSAAVLEGCYAINFEGAWSPLADGTKLNPFRMFLRMTEREGSPVKLNPSQLKSIRIRVQGEETTDLDEVKVEETKVDAIFDLSGRPVANPGKGVYIVGGKKVMMK